MASLFGLLNRLLPFATPGTPVLQDVLHLAAICTLLYLAPQIQERLQNARQATEQGHQEDHEQNFDDARANGELVAGGVNDHYPGTHPIAEPDVDEHAEDVNEEDNELPEEANGHLEEGQAGPARAPLIPEARNVGAKKAKALARRDQRRAYHEFQRSQGDAQRAREAEGAAERDKAQATEKERRKAAEAALEAKKAKEREEKRVKEEANRLEEQRRRERTIELVRSRLESDRMCDLFKVAREVGVDDEEWVERILRSSGILGQRGDTLTMITSVGWAIRVSAADMQRMYDSLVKDEKASDSNGRIDQSYVGSVLEASLRQRRA